MLGRHLLQSWSSTQPLVTLSSGEAEFHGVVKGAATGFGFQALLADFGVESGLTVWTDSTASMGICQRQGLERVRHLATQALWVQQRVRDGGEPGRSPHKAPQLQGEGARATEYVRLRVPGRPPRRSPSTPPR